MELFSIDCSTCKARLKVRDRAAIGQILACPKCGSMVQVKPPADWHDVAARDEPDVDGTADAAAEADATSEGDAPDRQWAEVHERRLRRRLIWMGVPILVGILLAVAGVSFFGRQAAVDGPVPVAKVAAMAEDVLEPVVDARWIPEDAKLVVSLPLSRMAGEEGFGDFKRNASRYWSAACEPLLGALGGSPGEIDRMSVATTSLADWQTQMIWVVEVDDARLLVEHLTPQAEEHDWRLGEGECVRIEGWPHPVCVVNETTLVTGRVDMLERLSGNATWAATMPALARVGARFDDPSQATIVLDVAAAGTADVVGLWPWLVAWLDEQPAWESLRERVAGWGVCVTAGESSERSVGMVFVGGEETAAEDLRGEVASLAGAAEEVVAEESSGWVTRVFGDRATPAQTHAVGTLRGWVGSWLADDDLVVEDEVVWWKSACEASSSELLAVMLAVSPRLEEERLLVARGNDEANQARLAGGLNEVAVEQGAYPVGAAGAVQLPPEQRLSWIATLLPMYGHPDWHAELNFRRPWNDAQNESVTKRALPEVVNPVMGAAQTTEGYPTTHYVGVAGVGSGAGDLNSSDARAGLFNFREGVRRESISAGLSQTLATLGVTEQTGPWSAGGSATVRALTRQPYVNGPDGFGSGQPDGMFAGMADGSVRFLSREIDPVVLERMATIHGPAEPTANAATELPAGAESGDAEGEMERPMSEPVTSDTADTAGASVDFDELLGLRLAAVDFEEIRLSYLVELLARMTDVEIRLDEEALLETGVTADTTVTVRHKDATVAEILRGVVEELGLICRVDAGGVVITAKLPTG